MRQMLYLVTVSGLVLSLVFLAGCGEETVSRQPDGPSAPDAPAREIETGPGQKTEPMPDVTIETREQAFKAINHTDLRVRWRAVGFLKSASETAFDDLQKAMDSDYEDVVSAAVSALVDIGPPDEVKPILIRALDHPYATVRTEAVIGLGNLGPAAEDTVPVIETRMESEDARFREKAREALEKING